jgi:hypothetical protein
MAALTCVTPYTHPVTSPSSYSLDVHRKRNIYIRPQACARIQHGLIWNHGGLVSLMSRFNASKLPKVRDHGGETQVKRRRPLQSTLSSTESSFLALLGDASGL